LIGLDTNVLIRYIIRDDIDQARLASEVINGFNAEYPGYISQITLAETVWVLMVAYKKEKSAIIEVIRMLLSARELIVEDPRIVRLALTSYQGTNAGFADALIEEGGLQVGCQKTVTFDKAAAKLPGMMLLAKDSTFDAGKENVT